MFVPAGWRPGVVATSRRVGLRLAGCVAAGALAAVLMPEPAGAASFTFSQIAGDTLTAEQAAAFGLAAAGWSAVLTDPVEIRLGIGFRDLGQNANGATLLGQTRPSFVAGGYAVYRSRLAADARSALDGTAVEALPSTVRTNQVLLTAAQARATGLGTGTASDGSIEFTSNGAVSFAATRAEMRSSTFDLIGVAAHEIGHVLGFISSLDVGTAIRSALDLFRYAGAGAPGFTAGEAAYLSVDAGATSLGGLSVGGPGQQQASHWLEGSGALLGPSLAPGAVQDITARDVAALDAVGWDAPVEVPEPGSAAVMLAGLGLLAGFGGGRGRLACRPACVAGVPPDGRRAIGAKPKE